MPDAYGIHEARYISYVQQTSAADALDTFVGPVPANTVWTILSALGRPSVAETQIVWFCIIGRDTNNYPITAPQSVALAPALFQTLPAVREGMELKLFPGEYLRFFRAAATAGSTITIAARYIASALPIYEEYEPQVRRAQVRRMSSGQRISAGVGVGSPGGSGVLGPGGLPGEGGGGEPLV